MDLEAQRAAKSGSEEDQQQQGMTLPFTQLTVTFRDIRYFVPMPGEVRWPMISSSSRFFYICKAALLIKARPAQHTFTMMPIKASSVFSHKRRLLLAACTLCIPSDTSRLGILQSDISLHQSTM